jgi:hypothetical protein
MEASYQKRTLLLLYQMHAYCIPDSNTGFLFHTNTTVYLNILIFYMNFQKSQLLLFFA